MNILVCVKQVPDTTEIKIDPVSNTLIRAGVPSIVNPFDAFALEMAVRLKEAAGGTVTVLSMGPGQAVAALKECLSVGADNGFLISDRVFGGSDTLATSYIIASAIQEKFDFDIIFCGKQAIDGDTGQVGPEIAEHLGIPQITYVVDVEKTEQGILALRETDDGYERVQADFPVLVTVDKTQYEPRYPTIMSKMASGRAEIPVIAAGDLALDVRRIGLKGSPTKVKKTFVPEVSKTGMVFAEDTERESVLRLLEALEQAKII